MVWPASKTNSKWIAFKNVQSEDVGYSTIFFPATCMKQIYLTNQDQDIYDLKSALGRFVLSPTHCQEICAAHPTCQYFIYHQHDCYMRTATTNYPLSKSDTIEYLQAQYIMGPSSCDGKCDFTSYFNPKTTNLVFYYLVVHSLKLDKTNESKIRI